MHRCEDGRLFVISGPSGAGKSTVIRRVMEKRDDLCFSVSVTTRAPRCGERDGEDYFFVTPERFALLDREGQLLEHAEYVGCRYGTPRAYVEDKLHQGLNVVLDIEVQGAAQVRARCPDAVLVFILPPSAAELENRLRCRHTDSEETIARRLVQARNECARAHTYDYIVINDDPDAAAGELDAIVTAELCRTACRIKYVTEVFAL